MNSILCLIQARSGSTRLPNKILKEIVLGKTLIDLVLERVRISKYIDKDSIVVLTTVENKDDELAFHLIKNNVKIFRGDENNVYNRFFCYLKNINNMPMYFVRICADNPFIDAFFVDELIKLSILDNRWDYISYSDKNGKPAILTHYGFFAEVIKCSSFINASANITTSYDQEHVTSYFYKSGKYKTYYIPIPEIVESMDIRMTVDTESDFKIAKEILSKMPDKFNYKDVISYVKSRTDIISVMSDNIRLNKK